MLLIHLNCGSALVTVSMYFALQTRKVVVYLLEIATLLALGGLLGFERE